MALAYGIYTALGEDLPVEWTTIRHTVTENAARRGGPLNEGLGHQVRISTRSD